MDEKDIEYLQSLLKKIGARGVNAIYEDKKTR